MRTKITLACTECKQRNYNTTKEKKNHPERMEIKKIIWPDRQATLKQSVAVVAISVALGVIIALLDYIAKNGVNFITSI